MNDPYSNQTDFKSFESNGQFYFKFKITECALYIQLEQNSTAAWSPKISTNNWKINNLVGLVILYNLYNLFVENCRFSGKMVQN